LPRAFGEGVEGLYARPVLVLVGGLTTSDEPGSMILDASNRLEVVSSPYGVGSGMVRTVGGTYTKGATGTTATLWVIPADNDVLYFMYGWILIGAARTGGAALLRAGITLDANTSDRAIIFLNDAGVAANEFFTLPGVGEAMTGITKTSPVSTPLQGMIPGANYYDGGDYSPASVDNARFFVENEGVANTEDLFIGLSFFSMNNQAPTITAGTSDTFV